MSEYICDIIKTTLALYITKYLHIVHLAYNNLILTFPVLMIMQVLSQGPSLLLAVWTGLALLEGGESVCSHSCGEFKGSKLNRKYLLTFISNLNVVVCVCSIKTKPTVL